MAQETRPLALVTGASTGIGYELAKICAENGFDLVVAADEPKIEDAARDLRKLGLGQGKAKLGRDFAQLLEARDFDRIERHRG